jgi:hypothetical protein
MTLDNQPTSDQGLPAVPGLKKVTACASGFIALALEGFGRDIAGPAGGPNRSDGGLGQGSIAARSGRTAELDQSRSAQFGSARFIPRLMSIKPTKPRRYQDNHSSED